MILMLLSGLFTPTRSMPSWAYLTTYVNPLSYFIEAIRTVFIRGGSLVDITPQVLALLGISSVMSLWSVLSYQKNSWYRLFLYLYDVLKEADIDPTHEGNTVNTLARYVGGGTQESTIFKLQITNKPYMELDI